MIPAQAAWMQASGVGAGGPSAGAWREEGQQGTIGSFEQATAGLTERQGCLSGGAGAVSGWSLRKRRVLGPADIGLAGL